MASRLITFCARILRPVIEEVVRQQWDDEDERLLEIHHANVRAAIAVHTQQAFVASFKPEGMVH